MLQFVLSFVGVAVYRLCDTEFVSHDLCMCHEFAACPISDVVQAAILTTRAFVTAGSALHHCASLSVGAFAVHPNTCAALFCLQQSSWLALSRIRAGPACAALLAEGSITPTASQTLRSARLRLPNCRLTPVSHIARLYVDVWTFECLHDMWLVACSFLVARCLAPAFHCWVLESCWLLVAHVVLAVLRQGRCSH